MEIQIFRSLPGFIKIAATLQTRILQWQNIRSESICEFLNYNVNSQSGLKCNVL